MKGIPPILVSRILMKYFWEEKTMQEIARELDISIGKARRYFHRGLFYLQKKANDQTEQEINFHRVFY